MTSSDSFAVLWQYGSLSRTSGFRSGASPSKITMPLIEPAAAAGAGGGEGGTAGFGFGAWARAAAGAAKVETAIRATARRDMQAFRRGARGDRHCSPRPAFSVFRATGPRLVRHSGMTVRPPPRLRPPRRLLAASLLGLALLAAAGGCKSDDPFTADMKMICAAGGDGDANLPPQLRKLAAMKEIAGKIKSPEAARLMARVIQVAPEEKAGLVREALAKAGLSRCAFLE